MTLLSDWNNRRFVAIITVIAIIVKNWHNHQNLLMRSAAEIKGWHVRQIDGGIMHHIEEIMLALTSFKRLADSHFLVDRARCHKIAHCDLPSEDFFADIYGMFVLHLATLRFRRFGYMLLTPPLNMLDAGKHDKQFEFRARAFRRHMAVYDKLEGMEKCAVLQKIYDRHVGHRVAVLQLRAASAEWASTVGRADTVSLLGRIASCLLPTQVIEDINGIEKNDKTLLQNRKYQRPEGMMAKLLKRQVLNVHHRFETSMLDKPVACKAVSLGLSVFRAHQENRSMDWSRIVTTAAPPPYPTMAPDSTAVPGADLVMLDEADGTADGLVLARMCWQGMVMKAEHKFCFRFTAKTKSVHKDWYMPMCHFDSSACFVWPMTRRKLEGYYNTFIFEVKRGVTEPVLLPIFDLDDIEAASWVLRSFWYMEVNYTKAKLPVAIYTVQSESIAPIKVIAAKAAFWTLTASQLQQLAALWGIDLATAESVPYICFKMCKSVLGLKDADAVDTIAPRLAAKDLHNTFTSELVQLDEAISFFDFHDLSAVNKNKDDAKKEIERRTDFARAHAELRVACGPPRHPALRMSLTWRRLITRR